MNTNMKKSSKTLFSIIMSFVIILFFILIFIPFLIKGKVTEAVQREAGNMMYAKVEFSDMRIDLIKHFPLISFNLKNIRITGTADEFKDDILLFAKNIELSVTPGSLLQSNSYEIKQILLSSPEIKAQVAPNGKVNWDIFKADTTHIQKDTLHPSSYTSFHLNLEKISIKNGQVSFIDLESMHGLECMSLNLFLKGELYKNDPLILISCNFSEINLSNISGNYQQEVMVSFNGSVKANFDQRQFVFNKNILTMGNLKSSLTGTVTIDENNFHSTIRFDKNNEQIKEILHLISVLYLKKYDQTKQIIPYTPAAFQQYKKDSVTSDSILIIAQQEADSILSKADEDIRLIMERAKNPLLQIAAEKAAGKIHERSRREARELIERAQADAQKIPSSH